MHKHFSQIASSFKYNLYIVVILREVISPTKIMMLTNAQQVQNINTKGIHAPILLKLQQQQWYQQLLLQQQRKLKKREKDEGKPEEKKGEKEENKE